MSVRITCINKDGGNHANPYEGITSFGWVNDQTKAAGRSTRAEMVEFLTKQGGRAYVKDALGNVAWIGVPRTDGTPFLRTYADSKWTDNLLSLTEC